MQELTPSLEPTDDRPAGVRRAWALVRARWWSRWAFDLVLLAVLAMVLFAWQTRHLLGDGERAPVLVLAGLDGARFDLAATVGTKTVVVFWSPWCPSCALEASVLESLHDDGVEVVSVMLSWESREAVEAFVDEHEITFPVLLGDEATRKAWSVESFPTIYVLDEDGRVEHTAVGYTTGPGLRWRLW